MRNWFSWVALLGLIISAMFFGYAIFSAFLVSPQINSSDYDNSSEGFISKSNESEIYDNNFYYEYTSKIEANNYELRKKAVEISFHCESGDKECQLVSIYDVVTNGIKYYSDPSESEFVQSPSQTLDMNAGDCEDKAILLNSLLENVGIDTYLVFTKDHAYSLACGLDLNLIYDAVLYNYSYSKLVDTASFVKSLNQNQTYFYELVRDPDYELLTEFKISSNLPLEVYLVEDKSQYNAFENYQEVEYYEVYTVGNGDKAVYDYFTLPEKSGFIFYNRDSYNLRLSLDINYYDTFYLIEPESVIISYLNVNGKKCFPMDPTIEFSYPGMDNEIDDVIDIVDSLTGDIVD